MKAVLTLILFSWSISCAAQQASIIKVVKNNQAYLTVAIDTDTGRATFSANCFIKPVTALPDSIKLNLLKQAFVYLDDTTTCYGKVRRLSSRYPPRHLEPVSTTYNLQVGAMVLINFIAFSGDASIYSPYPVLYDKSDSTEIPMNSPKLQTVVQVYKTWFEGIKQTGFKDYSFPLWNDRYEWFACRTARKVYAKYPQWLPVYDCMNINTPAPNRK